MVEGVKVGDFCVLELNLDVVCLFVAPEDLPQVIHGHIVELFLKGVDAQ